MLQRVVQIAIPILLAALISALSWLVIQNMCMKDELAKFRLAELEHYSELKQELALQRLTLTNIGNKVDKITTVRLRGDFNER